MAEIKLPTPPLPPDTPITVANLAQAIAEMMAKLPNNLNDAKVGDVFNNGGTLAVNA